jgi:hypothetical protein
MDALAASSQGLLDVGLRSAARGGNRSIDAPDIGAAFVIMSSSWYKVQGGVERHKILGRIQDSPTQ